MDDKSRHVVRRHSLSSPSATNLDGVVQIKVESSQHNPFRLVTGCIKTFVPRSANYIFGNARSMWAPDMLTTLMAWATVATGKGRSGCWNGAKS